MWRGLGLMFRVGAPEPAAAFARRPGLILALLLDCALFLSILVGNM
jgi:hypothetical protein